MRDVYVTTLQSLDEEEIKMRPSEIGKVASLCSDSVCIHFAFLFLSFHSDSHVFHQMLVTSAV
jgi:hypothetical protein